VSSKSFGVQRKKEEEKIGRKKDTRRRRKKLVDDDDEKKKKRCSLFKEGRKNIESIISPLHFVRVLSFLLSVSLSNTFCASSSSSSLPLG